MTFSKVHLRSASRGFLLSLTLVLLFTGCDALVDSGPDTVSQDLQGRWISSCDRGTARVLDFDGSRFTIDVIRYRTSACEKVSRAGHNIVQGTFAVGGTYTTDDGMTATKLDLTYTFGQENIADTDPGAREIYRIEEQGGQRLLYFGSRKAINRPRPAKLRFDRSYTQSMNQGN